MAKNRRPKGTGSIRARGSRYEASYSYVDGTGRRRRRSATFDTKTQAREWLTSRIAHSNASTPANAGNVTIAEYLTQWVQAQTGQVSEKTASWYRWAVTKHLIPTLGNLRLSRLTAVRIDQLLRAKMDDGVGRETLRAIRITLGKAMGDAERKGLIEKNPVTLADKPRLARPDATLQVWVPEEISEFLHLIDGDRMSALWRAAAMTGLRRSEVCGLQWSDVDLEEGVVLVRRAVVVDRGRPVVKEPKTSRSRRTVDIDQGTVSSLREWRRRQIEERLRAGEAWAAEDWVFTDQLGRRVNPEWVGKRFRKLVERADLTPITMRQLRHSHATALLRAGVHPKVVQERLGHSSIAVTLDTYSSVLPTMQRDAVERLADLIESR